MVESAEDHQLTAESLFLAVGLVDRFLVIHQVETEELQLLASAALLLAAKVEEQRGQQMIELLVEAGEFSKQQLLKMEVAILQAVVRSYCNIAFNF